MADLRLIHFTDAEHFLSATKPIDEAFMNFTLGPLLESIDPVQREARNLGNTSRVLLGVYRGKHLLATFIKAAKDFAWVLGVPQAFVPLSDEDSAAVISLLVSYLPSAIDSKSLDKIVGPEDLVNRFLEHWVAEMRSQGLRIEVLPPFFRAKVTYATLATIPPPPPRLSQYRIEPATARDVEPLAQLFVEFMSDTPVRKLPLDDARTKMALFVRLGQIWLCRVDGEIAGYCATGRMTPRTGAIRNVYVSPKHRRKGIAEAFTRALTRYLLGAEPLGFEGAPPGPPPQGIKHEIALNVAEDHVERLYKRCGFLLPEDDCDPATGRRGWFDSTYRGVKFLDE